MAQPKLMPCRKIITISNAGGDAGHGNLQMFDADMGYHQWFINYDNFMGPHCYSWKQFDDIFIDEAMNIYICGRTSTECSNYPNRTNEHSGQGSDGFLMKTSPKGYFYHFNQLSTDLPPGWSVYRPEGWQVKDGTLQFAGEGGGVWLAFLNQILFNYNVQVACTKTAGSATGDYGLIFREYDNIDIFYKFNIDIAGNYMVDMLDGQGWKTLISKRSTPYVKKGLNQCNILRVTALDSVVKFYCNGGYLDEIKVTNLHSGRVGVFGVGTSVQEKVEFDNFYVGSYTFNVTDVSQNQADQSIPAGFTLFQNYPNPFNPVTTIKYSIPKSSKVTVKIYNTRGREITTLVDEDKQAGHYAVQWNGKTKTGSICPSALYFCSLKTEHFLISRKLMLLR
ncbi:T9SS type A sorting domain-containing protein [candidate division KSB1 bacterium]|nr:T9SS type A sorting domain-containing protein [candidate division KSB1 bacterium]